MTLKTWLELFEHYKKYHNFRAKGGIFKEDRGITRQEEWLPF
jgi:hypothetical protein